MIIQAEIIREQSKIMSHILSLGTCGDLHRKGYLPAAICSLFF